MPPRVAGARGQLEVYRQHRRSESVHDWVRAPGGAGSIFDDRHTLREERVRPWRAQELRKNGGGPPVAEAPLLRLPEHVAPADFQTFLALKPTDAIPASILNKYDVETIAEMLVLRLNRLYEEGKPVVPPEDSFIHRKHIPDYDYGRGAVAQVFFPLEIAEKIQSAGAIRNFHETGTTPTGATRAERLLIEQSLAGLNLDYLSESSPYSEANKVKIRQLLPKYGNLQLTQVVDIKNSYWPLSQAAGAGIAVMKEAIKRRMTSFGTDSVAISRGQYKTTPTAQLVKEGVLGTFASRHLVGLDGYGNAGNTYRESHIWGPLSTGDVEYYMVPPGAPAQHVEALKSTGRPIFEWSLYEVGLGGRTPQTFYVPSEFELGSP